MALIDSDKTLNGNRRAAKPLAEDWRRIATRLYEIGTVFTL